MAFANWLGNQLKMKVTLPTVAQWQRAAKGDDDRYFPWGDEYHEEHCNTLETGLKATTPVDRYHKGISPYGVYDMAGNIWEWTLNTAAAADEGRDYRRAVAGGSFVSHVIARKPRFVITWIHGYDTRLLAFDWLG